LGKTNLITGAAGITAAGALGIGHVLSNDQAGETYSYRVNRGLNSLIDRIKADEAIGGAFAKGLGSESSKALIGLTTDIVGKGYDTLKDTLRLSPVRSKIFNTLKKEDPILHDTDNKTLMEAYHTIANIAPVLSTDKNAVKSILRMAATSGGGLDYTTIKGIADAEAAVHKARSERTKVRGGL